MSEQNPINNPRVSEALEALCAHGCQAVWSIIEELEAGKPRPETAHLPDGERLQVLRELKAIMSVYGSCSLK